MDTRSRHLLKVGIVANVFEWYEFFIFIFLSNVIGQLFFEASEPIIELLRAYSVFALSFIARPLGGLFFGRVGDRIGRSAALRLSLILMSVPTILIGVLPIYNQIGVIAPISLVLLRLTQGFAAGGELPLTACYVFEGASSENRSFLCSVTAISPKLGMLVASLVCFLLTQFFDAKTITQGAWRIPFLLGIPLTLFIVYLRQAIQESNLISSPNHLVTSEDWVEYIIPITKAVSLVSFGALYFYIVLAWMPDYLIHFLNISPYIATLSKTVTLCAILPSYFAVHYLANYFGYRRLLLGSLLLMLLTAFIGFKALQTASSWHALLAIHFLLALVYVGFDGVLIETLGELFPAKARSLSFGIAWTLAAAFIGGTTPLVCTYVIHKTGFLMFPAFYIAFFGFLALPVVLGLVKSTPQKRIEPIVT